MATNLVIAYKAHIGLKVRSGSINLTEYNCFFLSFFFFYSVLLSRATFMKTWAEKNNFLLVVANSSAFVFWLMPNASNLHGAL